ncbi:MAG: hypothetical protein WCU88_03645 [Elusimicrobiota bacterium]|jgi:hypothetical protein
MKNPVFSIVVSMILLAGTCASGHAQLVYQGFAQVARSAAQVPAIEGAQVSVAESEDEAPDQGRILFQKEADIHTLVNKLMDDNQGECVRVYAAVDAFKYGRIYCERSGSSEAEKRGSDIPLYSTAFGLIVAGDESFFVHRPTMMILSLQVGDLSDADKVEDRLAPAIVTRGDLRRMLKQVKKERF